MPALLDKCLIVARGIKLLPLERLRISSNRHHLVTENGQPFFWLADTAWTIICHLKIDEIRAYFEKRSEQGFNVIQMAALNPETNPDLTNALGVKPFHSTHPLNLNPKYFEYIDQVLDLAEEYGLYVALLPTWGELVTGWTWTGEGAGICIDKDNAYLYGLWLGERYRNRTNIVWVLGGDRHPVHDDEDYRGVWRSLAEGIGRGVTVKNLRWNLPDPAWSELLITYHPCFTDSPEIYTSSHWLSDDVWISFNMIQSGHRQHVENYNQIRADYDRRPIRPVLDGEPNYEDWRFHSGVHEDFHRDWNVRKRAYWSILAGACGHTYGHNSVWCMLTPERGLQAGTLSWRGALERPGAQQMLHLRRLMESRPFYETEPDQTLILGPSRVAGSMDTRLQACLDLAGRFALIYSTSGGKILADLTRFDEELVNAWWFDPRTGCVCDAHGALTDQPFSELATDGFYDFQPPTSGFNNDWVLVLDVANSKFPLPGRPL